MRSDLSFELRRECQCRSCKKPIPDFAPLHQRYCQALCRANAWSRANRQFSSTITVADFENVRETIKQFSARMNRVVVRYALVGSHPIGKVARQIGDSTFPPKDRKTKRMPDETGRTRFRSTPSYSFGPWFEGPRVPVVGSFRLNVWFEGNARPTETNLIVDVRKSFPAVHFYDEKTGQRYTLKGEVIPPKAPKPPKPPTERRKRRPAAAIGPQPERVPSTERVPELVSATAAQRAPDAELVARVKKLEEERAIEAKQRAELLASMEKERKEHAAIRQDLEQKRKEDAAIRQDLEQKLDAALAPRAPSDAMMRMSVAASNSRLLESQLEKVERSHKEQEKQMATLSKERDELTNTVAEQKRGQAKLASQIITLEERATKAERERAELAAKLSEVERQRDELAAKPAHQAAPAATADGATTDEGTDSTTPSSPTGIEIPRLAYGKLPPVSSPKTGPPSLGILGQNHRSPIRGSANKKHKRR